MGGKTSPYWEASQILYVRRALPGKGAVFCIDRGWEESNKTENLRKSALPFGSKTRGVNLSI